MVGHSTSKDAKHQLKLYDNFISKRILILFLFFLPFWLIDRWLILVKNWPYKRLFSPIPEYSTYLEGKRPSEKKVSTTRVPQKINQKVQNRSRYPEMGYPQILTRKNFSILQDPWTFLKIRTDLDRFLWDSADFGVLLVEKCLLPGEKHEKKNPP